MFIDFRERETEKETSTCEGNIDQFPPVHTPTRNQNCNPGTCPDRDGACGLLVCETPRQPAEPPSQGFTVLLDAWFFNALFDSQDYTEFLHLPSRNKSALAGLAQLAGVLLPPTPEGCRFHPGRGTRERQIGHVNVSLPLSKINKLVLGQE